MLVDLLALVLAIIAVGLVPVVLMASLFRIIDYLADDEKLEEIRQASREGRPVDFTGGDVSGDHSTERAQVTRETDAEASICPNCGEENESDFDRCWNCQASL